MDGVSYEPEDIEDMLERAAERGARRALKDVGLADDEAIHDMHELRDLLESWRSVKKTVGQTVLKFITVAILGAIAAIIGMSNWPD